MKLVELYRVASGIDFDRLAWEISTLLTEVEGIPRTDEVSFLKRERSLHDELFGPKATGYLHGKVLLIAGEWNVTEIRTCDSSLMVTVQIPDGGAVAPAR